jgi:TolA-binding protein
MRTRTAVLLVFMLLAAGLVSSATRASAQTAEEQARRRFATGRDSLQNRRYQEALRDFRAVADDYKDTSVADDALLEIARYELEVGNSLQRSQEALDRLLKEHKDSDSAPMAHLLVGRVAMARGRTQADIDAAIGSFSRVEGLFPRSDAVPEALYYKGEVFRLVDRHTEAIPHYRDVTLRYPRTLWAARAHIGLSLTLARTGNALAAIDELQRVRLRFPDSPEADRAERLLTILYRLYVLPTTGVAPYQWSTKTLAGPAGRLRDILNLTMSPGDDLAATNDLGTLVFEAGKTAPTMVRHAPAYSAYYSRLGRLVIAGKGVLRVDPSTAIPLAAPQVAKPPRPLGELRAAVGLSTGDVLVSDGDTKSVLQFSESGKYIGEFSKTDASRLVVNQLDHVAMLDRESVWVTIVDRDRKTLLHVGPRGQGFEFKNPVDIAFDAFGHLYVLDRGSFTVWVFTPDGKLRTQFTLAEKAPGAFARARTLTLDSAGRLFIFDERAEAVRIYR